MELQIHLELHPITFTRSKFLCISILLSIKKYVSVSSLYFVYKEKRHSAGFKQISTKQYLLRQKIRHLGLIKFTPGNRIYLILDRRAVLPSANFFRELIEYRVVICCPKHNSYREICLQNYTKHNLKGKKIIVNSVHNFYSLSNLGLANLDIINNQVL